MSSFQHIPTTSTPAVFDKPTLKEEVHILSQIYLALDRERQERIIVMMHEMSFAWAKEKSLGKERVLKEVQAATA